MKALIAALSASPHKRNDGWKDRSDDAGMGMQGNGDDCGVFVCHYMFYVISSGITDSVFEGIANGELDFRLYGSLAIKDVDAVDTVPMPYLRRCIVYEIVQGEILRDLHRGISKILPFPSAASMNSDIMVIRRDLMGIPYPVAIQGDGTLEGMEFAADIWAQLQAITNAELSELEKFNLSIPVKNENEDIEIPLTIIRKLLEQGGRASTVKLPLEVLEAYAQLLAKLFPNAPVYIRYTKALSWKYNNYNSSGGIKVFVHVEDDEETKYMYVVDKKAKKARFFFGLREGQDEEIMFRSTMEKVVNFFVNRIVFFSL